MKTEERYLSVSQLNAFIKAKFDDDSALSDLYLKGELSNFKVYSSGHAYFSLKDADSIISGLMWSSSVGFLSFVPKDGDEVLVHGRVTVYPQQGKYQIYCDRMELFGQGSELLKLKELARKLQAEGLFDEKRKRSLPKFPKTIGIITAKGSAAIKDMAVNIQNRWPLVDIVVFPSLVQGKEAPADLLRAFRASQDEKLDVLIIGRGGGSSEDLNAFNDEKLVRALASSNCPTISAVGHEIDVTLTDYVCDKRVSTPTGAAVAAVPDKVDVLQRLDEIEETMGTFVNNRLVSISQRFDSLRTRGFFANPALIYQKRLDDLEQIKKRFTIDFSNQMVLRKQDVVGLKQHLAALSPFGVLGRGYSITTKENGKIVVSAKEMKPGDVVRSQFKDGIIHSQVVDEKEKKDE